MLLIYVFYASNSTRLVFLKISLILLLFYRLIYADLTSKQDDKNLARDINYEIDPNGLFIIIYFKTRF